VKWGRLMIIISSGGSFSQNPKCLVILLSFI